MLVCFLNEDEIELMLKDSICQLLRNSDNGYIFGDILLIIGEKYPYCSATDVSMAIIGLEKSGKIVCIDGYYKIL